MSGASKVGHRVAGPEGSMLGGYSKEATPGRCTKPLRLLTRTSREDMMLEQSAYWLLASLCAPCIGAALPCCLHTKTLPPLTALPGWPRAGT